MNSLVETIKTSSVCDEAPPAAAIIGEPAWRDTTDTNTEDLQQKFGAYRPSMLSALSREMQSSEQLVVGLLPSRSITLLVGDSGLGKSPLLYQLALCVATGQPFLEFPVRQGAVIIFDHENGVGQTEEILSTVGRFLGLDSLPDANLLIWNANCAPVRWGREGYTHMDLVRAVRPSLVVIDPLVAILPEMEARNEIARRVFQDTLRPLISEIGCSIAGIHHIRKQSTRSEHPVPSLVESDWRRWFDQTRGAGAMINASDVRLGVDAPGFSIRDQTNDGRNEETALIMRGFGRVRGEIPLMHITRVYDGDGKPLGYSRATGTSLLDMTDQRNTYSALPSRFRFTEAKTIYGRRDQATIDFLKKCQGLGLLRKDGNFYEKVQASEN